MNELLFHLTDDVSWEFSPFFRSKLKINTVVNCIFFFLSVAFICFCEESLRGQFVPLEMEGKEECTCRLLTHFLPMAVNN